MTREEAIEILKDLWRTKHSMYLEADIRKALEMAIRALEQSMPTMVYPQVDGITPTVVAQADGEYILKKDVMGCIGQTSLHWELARKLRKLPSVAIPSAEPREVLYSGDGYADGYMVYDMAECPNCGREFEDGDETWNCNFCPDCGQALKWDYEGR